MKVHTEILLQNFEKRDKSAARYLTSEQISNVETRLSYKNAKIVAIKWDFIAFTNQSLSEGKSFVISSSIRHEFEPPHSGGSEITHKDAPQSVGLLWRSDQPVAKTSA
jgi:hypothetical protein